MVYSSYCTSELFTGGGRSECAPDLEVQGRFDYWELIGCAWSDGDPHCMLLGEVLGSCSRVSRFICVHGALANSSLLDTLVCFNAYATTSMCLQWEEL
jgi:hypothetical protein